VPAHAIGYKNWPIRLDRSVLVVHNGFALVRDRVSFTLPVSARLGQNWVTMELGQRGPNWVNSCIPWLYGQLAPPLKPITGGTGELLIWFVANEGAAVQVVHGAQCSWYGQYGHGDYINLQKHIWAPLTGTWNPDDAVGFATLLYPHAPDEAVPAAALAARIQTVQHDATATTLRIATPSATYLLLVNNTLADRPLGAFVVDAEAAVLTLTNEVPTRLSLWHVSHVQLGERVLLAGDARIDLSTTTFGPGTLRVWTEPTPIRWRTGPGGVPEAEVRLTVHCVDSVTNAPVGGTVIGSDPGNVFALPTNLPQQVWLHKVPSREGGAGDPIVYDDPQAQVIALGYPPVTVVVS
jgi:hypothetical protein